MIRHYALLSADPSFQNVHEYVEREKKRERETKTEISFEAQVFRYAIHISQFADYMYTTTQF